MYLYRNIFDFLHVHITSIQPGSPQPQAMVALMAMLFQNGTVGTTGPAMWLPAA